MLKIENISKFYYKQNRKITAVDNISLKLAPGSFIAVKGQSGSGKTSLLHTVGGVLKPDEGSVLINNHDLYSLNKNERAEFRARHIGFVFQQFHLIPYLTVAENIAAPQLAGKIKLNNRIHELMEKFGLSERRAHLPKELSAGEKQRTALARALLFSPQVLLADEVTGNLDPVNSSLVLDTLREFTDNGGIVILVTHDEAAAGKADKILTITNGAIN